jgi:hypothetical protein
VLVKVIRPPRKHSEVFYLEGGWNFSALTTPWNSLYPTSLVSGTLGANLHLTQFPKDAPPERRFTLGMALRGQVQNLQTPGTSTETVDSTLLTAGGTIGPWISYVPAQPFILRAHLGLGGSYLKLTVLNPPLLNPGLTSGQTADIAGAASLMAGVHMNNWLRLETEAGFRYLFMQGLGDFRVGLNLVYYP